MDDFEIFRSAHEKNYDPLIKLLRSDVELLPRHRDLLAKILEGKITRPAHRKAKTLRDLRRMQGVARYVRSLEANGCKQMAAIAQAADKFCCSVGTVKTALRADRATQDAMAMVETGSSKLKSLWLEGERGPMSDMVRAMEDLTRRIYAEFGLKFWSRPRIWDEDNNLILF